MLPEAFLRRMQALLGEEYPAFLAASEEPPVRALRTNPFKPPSESALAAMRAELSLSPVPYGENGYFFSSEHVGATPWHHAGAFYVQDPGAMSAVAAVRLPKDARILDLCAAPGGKSFQAISAAQAGLLISNEISLSRARTTVGNFERLGIPNALVTSLDTSALPTLFDSYFDLVICDAPCSGEGMFRKNGTAAQEWSEGAVHSCAERQDTILNNAASLVKTGGKLLYSTCTYSLEENEGSVARFLAAHADFRLVPTEDAVTRVTSPGHVPCGASAADLSLCRRFYPHVSHGEGQFIAVMERFGEHKTPSILYKDSSLPLTRAEDSLLRDFFASATAGLPPLCLRRHKESIIALPAAFPVPRSAVLMAGVTVGRIEKGRLLPHHQFFSAYGAFFSDRLSLSRDDPRLLSYLHGEEIASEGENGFVAVLCDGIPLGGGKRVGGRVRNYYPKGLRV